MSDYLNLISFNKCNSVNQLVQRKTVNVFSGKYKRKLFEFNVVLSFGEYIVIKISSLVKRISHKHCALIKDETKILTQQLKNNQRNNLQIMYLEIIETQL